MTIKAWNDEQEQELIKLYTIDNQHDVHKLAKVFDKGYRSVISKLVQLRIYIKPENKNIEKTPSVKSMLRDLENMLNIQIAGVNLNKKDNLKMLLDAMIKKIEELTVQ